mgnify:CR=1 FL=1
MALTKIGTDGVKDDAVTSDKVANSINSAIAANTAKTQTTINNNANNRVITGSGTANTLNAESDVVIDSSGRTLIGTTSILHSQDHKLYVAGTGASTSISLNRYSDNDFASYIFFRKSRNGTVGGNTIVQNNDLLGRIYFEGNDGSSPVSAAYIEAHVDGTPGNQDMPGRLEFLTAADGTPSPVERMRIDSSGNVQIANDSGKLQLGASQDLELYHNGSNSYVSDNGTGELRLASFNGNSVRITKGDSETLANFNVDGRCELYNDNVLKIFTEAEGASVCGDGNDVHLRLRDSSDNVRGIVHATASVDVGFITADATAWLFRVHDDGSYQHYGSEISDRDKKDNITTISSTSLDKVTKLVPKTFTFKQDETGKVPTDKVFTGFIAQEVKEHLPNIVTGTDGQKDMAVDYNGILAHAVKAITELSAEVEILKTKVAALEAA